MPLRMGLSILYMPHSCLARDAWISMRLLYFDMHVVELVELLLRHVLIHWVAIGSLAV